MGQNDQPLVVPEDQHGTFADEDLDSWEYQRDLHNSDRVDGSNPSESPSVHWDDQGQQPNQWDPESTVGYGSPE